MSIVGAVDPEAVRARRRFLWSRIAIYSALIVFAAIYLLPALIVVANSFRTRAEVGLNGIIAIPQSFTLDAWIRAWTTACVSGTCRGIAPNFYNSLIITIPATIVATVLGALNGYVLSKWRFRGDNLVFAGILLGVFMPFQIALLPWAFIMGKLGLANSVYGLIIIHSVQGIAFTTLLCRNYFAALPDELIKAARVDGAGFWRIFHKIVLPLSPPILIVCIIWQFTAIWNEYLFGVVFTSGSQQPITAALQSISSGSGAAVVIAALPPLLIFLFGGRYFVRGLTQGALK